MSDELSKAKEYFLEALRQHTIDRWSEARIKENKTNFPENEEDLRDLLQDLNLPELEDYLVYIPFHQFEAVEILGKGGFATVYKATIRLPNGFVWIDYDGDIMRNQHDQERIFALKEMTTSLLPEVTHDPIASSAHLSPCLLRIQRAKIKYPSLHQYFYS